MLNDIHKKCKENNVSLIYLVKFGSHLYGTNTPESDTDYKGIFLPSMKQLLLQQNIKSITYSTGDNNDKNSSEDVDVQLWSLHYFLKLVSKGETNALDLLFSFTYTDMIEYMDDIMIRIHDNYNNLFNIKDCNAFVGYAIGQAKKYGIKGSRLGVLKKVNRLVNTIKDIDDIKLHDIMDDIIDKCYDSSYCFKKMIGTKGNEPIQSLVICGKVHQGTINVTEFIERINTEYKKYGKRAEQAEKSLGIDWKALSHAVRALTQMKQLINTGMIQYPLADADYISSIKMGKLSFKEVEKIIYDSIGEIDEKLNGDSLVVKNKRDNKLIESIILDAYK